MADVIKVVVVDDHALIREAIKGMLVGQRDMVLVAEGSTGEHVFSLVNKHRPDVLILDLNMPQSSSSRDNEKFPVMDSLTRLNEEFPEVAVIVLSQYASRPFIDAAINNNVRGYLLKSDDMTLNLLDAIHTVVQGGTLFSREINTILFGKKETNGSLDTLTERQVEIVRSYVLWPDLSTAHRAAELGITESTLKSHLYRIFKVLDATSVTSCLVKAMQVGLIPFHLNERGMVEFDWQQM
jgi:DNA-binding NarL/FixJ family response regulator